MSDTEIPNRFPNLGKLSIALLEHTVKPFIGEKAIDEIKSPVVEKELINSLVIALEKTEKRFVSEYSDKEICDVILNLPLSTLPSVTQAIRSFYSSPNEPFFSQILSKQIESVFPRIAPERLDQGISIYIRFLKDELANLNSEIREKLGIYAIFEIRNDTARIANTIERIEKNQSEQAQTEFTVFIDLGLDPTDEREYDELPHLWQKARLLYRLFVQSNNYLWADSLIVGMVFYSGDRLYTSESKLPQWILNSIEIDKKPIHHRILHHSTPLQMINPSIPIRTDWLEAYLSINHSPWQASVYVLAKNLPPAWYQLTIAKNNPVLVPQSGQGVQVRELELHKVEKPVVSVGEQNLL